MTAANTSTIEPASPTSAGLRWSGIVLSGIALATGVWIAQRLDERRMPSFSGRLQARVTTIAAQQTARLKQISVTPGQRIAPGNELLTLQFDQEAVDLTARRQDATKKIQEANRIKAAADLELQWRRREIQSEMFQTQLKLAGLREEKLHRDVEQLAWRERLSAQSVFTDQANPAPLFQFVGKIADEDSEERVKNMLREDAAAGAAQALATQIELCEQRLEDLRTLDQQLETQIRTSFGVDAAEELARQASDELAASESAPETTVVSPAYGIVGQFRKQAGDLVENGETLVQILDDERWTVDVEVPSWAAVKFSMNQHVQLEFPGKEMRTGVVTEIPPQTLASNEHVAGDVLVRLTIGSYGKVWPSVPVGSKVLVFEPR
ncbi:MAG: HlyD family efflux transporter periplasmic adaptor subunit [Planctomycetaceae bacterium]